MTQSSPHMQQLNAENEGHNIGEAKGVFPGGSDKPIGQDLSFLENMASTQGGNDVDIIVATPELQCAASVYAASIRRSAQTIM